MKFTNKKYCDLNMSFFLSERKYFFNEPECVISFTLDGIWELMIFLGKDEKSTDYEVRVYKNEPTDKYVPCKELDQVKRYEENDEYASFFFEDYEVAVRFVRWVRYFHKEYKKRPARRIVK